MAKSHHKSDGTFASGDTLSDNRGKYARRQAFQDEFASAITPADVKKLARQLVSLASDGDMNAMKLLLTHLFTPAKTSAPSTAIQINNNPESQADRTARIRAAIREMRDRETRQRIQWRLQFS